MVGKLAWLALAAACGLGYGCMPDLDGLDVADPAGLGSSGDSGAGSSGYTSGASALGGRSGESGANGKGGTLSQGGTQSQGGTAGGSSGADSQGGSSAAGGNTSAGNAGGEGGATAEPGCPDIAGKALYLASDSLVGFKRTIQDDFTIEVWVRKTSSTPTQGWWLSEGLLWADVDGAQNDFALSVMNGKLVMNVGNPDQELTSTSNVATGKWVHLAVAREESTGFVKLYVNGGMEGVMAASNKPLAAAPAITMGSSVDTSVFFDGEIDELRLWSRVRTAAELVANMHRRLRGDEPGLVGYYRFDAAPGNSLADLSPSKANATLFGSRPLVVSTAPICDAEAAGAAGAGGSQP